MAPMGFRILNERVSRLNEIVRRLNEIVKLSSHICDMTRHDSMRHDMTEDQGMTIF